MAASERETTVWRVLLDLAARQRHWTLVGARMVELHALERGRVIGRVTVDADALADARERPNPIRGLVDILTAAGFTLDEPNAFGEAHTFRREDVEIDVLAPDHLGARAQAARVTVAPAHTVQVPGGRQALARTELVTVQLGRRRGVIPRPNLLGAILLKARAVELSRATVHRSDLALLLSLVGDPDVVAAEVSRAERGWLRRRSEMDDPAADCWTGIGQAQRIQGVAALRILAGA